MLSRTKKKDSQKLSVDIPAPAPAVEPDSKKQEAKLPATNPVMASHLGFKEEILVTKKRTIRPFFLKADETKSIFELKKELDKLAVPFDDCFDRRSLLERLTIIKDMEKKRGVNSRFIEHNWQSSWNNPKNWTSETHRLLYTHGLYWKYLDDIVASTYQAPSQQAPQQLPDQSRRSLRKKTRANRTFKESRRSQRSYSVPDIYETAVDS